MPISGFHPCVNLSGRYGPPARGAFVGKGRNSGKFSPGSGSRTLGAVLSKANDLILCVVWRSPSGCNVRQLRRSAFLAAKKILNPWLCSSIVRGSWSRSLYQIRVKTGCRFLSWDSSLFALCA